MYLNNADLVALATGPPGQGEALLKQLDVEHVQLMRTVQNKKQGISTLMRKNNQGIAGLRPQEVNKVRVCGCVHVNSFFL